MVNEQNLIHIKAIRIEKMNINRENVNQSILKSNLKGFIGNELEAAAGRLGWTLISYTKALKDQLPFDIYTFTYKSLVTQESVFVTVECE